MRVRRDAGKLMYVHPSAQTSSTNAWVFRRSGRTFVPS
jgi:hypothetical protein